MFTCVICNEIFIGIHLNSAYTTQCGHVFHHQCIMRWLERSPSCPHCRSSVLENNVVKLFLQVDDNIRITRIRETDEEINTLKKQLKILKEKETQNSSSIKCLEVQLRKKEIDLASSRESLRYFEQVAEKQKKENSALNLLKVEYNASEIERKKLKAENLLLKSKIKFRNYELYNLQSSNSSYIDKLKLEIADLKSKIAYVQTYYNIEDINIEQPSTSKMNIGNKNALSFQNENKTRYYGPDSQLHTFKEQFLLGCVFLFVDNQIQHGDFNVCNHTIISKEDITKHGGSVEQNYSVHVTHVICVTQKHHLVELGINDGKRCVTYYWLIDIFLRKTMIAPWLAIHFPIPYSIENMPCQNFQFAIANFGINERQIIKSMIELVGGYVNDITCRTDIVVSLNTKGELVEKALTRHIPVVNVQWLNDILLGEKICIKEHGLLKFKQFDLCNPFLVNFNMVSCLMEAWKTPLILCQSQQDITKHTDFNINSAGPTKCKRQKTMSIETQQRINSNDDDIDDDDVIITYIKKCPLKPCVVFSGFSTDDEEILKMILHLFGGKLANHYAEATHLVMKKPVTSIEFFGCLSTVKYVLNEQWLRDSHSSLILQDEKEYFIQNIQHQLFGLYNITTILANNKRHLLFRYLSFFVTPGIKYPPSSFFEQIIFSAGGTIERTRRSLESIHGLAPNSYFIISCQEDHYLYKDLLGISNVVYSPEFITCSFLAQQVQLQKYLLEITAQD
ncbi:PAX-interacting protein 1-like [Myzus persicae]|uniref:PAX-interacting protein 1-like n=1 Tax=Myzus persicae TaxID=13164 RepID=UPI000B938CD7|nr:PAX-interacting protein 1-like [Myzus persicae]